MAAHTNVCVIGLGSMGMGAACACLQALNTGALTSIPTTVAHCWRRAPKARAPARCRSPRNWMQLCCWWSMPPRCGDLFGESGLAAHLEPGTVVMVSSTIASADAQAIAEALAEYQLLMLDAPVSGGAVSGRRRHDGDGLRERCRLCPPRAGAGRRGRQSLPHRERHWSWLDGKNYPSAAGRGAHRRCRRSDGACRPRRDPTGNDV